MVEYFIWGIAFYDQQKMLKYLSHNFRLFVQILVIFGYI